MTEATPTSNNVRGIYTILAGMLVITLQDSAVKLLSPDYALHQIMLSRAVLALVITFGILKYEGGFHLLRTKHLKWHLTRAVMYAQTTEPGTFDAELEALCKLVESSACDMAGVTLAEYGRAIGDSVEGK